MNNRCHLMNCHCMDRVQTRHLYVHMIMIMDLIDHSLPWLHYIANWKWTQKL